MDNKRKSIGRQENAKFETFEELAERIRTKQKNDDSEKTYNEGLKKFLPEWQLPYVNSYQFVDICLAFRKLNEDYTQENKHKLSVKRHAFEFYCTQKMKENEIC